MMKSNLVSKFLVGSTLLATLALTGCGGAAPTGIDDSAYDDSSAIADPYAATPTTDTGYTDPSSSYTGGTSTGTGYNLGGELTASVVKVKNGSFLGMGKCVVTVEVNNPSTQQLTGDLTVTFTNKGKPTSNVQTQSITVSAGETRTLTFEDKKWSTDNATAEIITNTPAVSTGSAYGNTGSAYGNTGSSYPSTGYGNSY